MEVGVGRREGGGERRKGAGPQEELGLEVESGAGRSEMGPRGRALVMEQSSARQSVFASEVHSIMLSRV